MKSTCAVLHRAKRFLVSILFAELGILCVQRCVLFSHPETASITAAMLLRLHVQSDNTVKEPYLKKLQSMVFILFFDDHAQCCLCFILCMCGVPCRPTQEIRNGNASRLLIALVQSRTFQCANHSHLLVGHTHEDIDAVLSVVKRAIDAEAVMQTPADLMRAIDRKLEPLFTDQNMMFKTIWVDQDAWPDCSWFPMPSPFC